MSKVVFAKRSDLAFNSGSMGIKNSYSNLIEIPFEKGGMGECML